MKIYMSMYEMLRIKDVETLRNMNIYENDSYAGQ